MSECPIWFKQNGDSVELVARGSYPLDDNTFSFNFLCSHGWIAKALHWSLSTALADYRENLRKEAYQQGYRDGRGHKSKLY